MPSSLYLDDESEEKFGDDTLYLGAESEDDSGDGTLDSEWSTRFEEFGEEIDLDNELPLEVKWSMSDDSDDVTLKIGRAIRNSS